MRRRKKNGGRRKSNATGCSEQNRWSAPEGAKRPRRGLVIVPRWADAPVPLRPVTPTGYSFRLRHGFLTVLIRGRGHEEREKRFVGLFHLTHSDGFATLVVEYTGQARAIAPTAAPDSST